MRAYIDGSYNADIRAVGYGIYLTDDRGKYIDSLCGRVTGPDWVTMRNVAGELVASIYTMMYCLEHNIREIDIYYDYEGVRKFCSGEWSANLPCTKVYGEFYRTMRAKGLNIRFHKITAHTDDIHNQADLLAKQGCRQ